MIEVETLSRVLNNLASQIGFQGFKIPHGHPVTTRFVFVDDVLIFANRSIGSLQNIMQVLDMYQKSSGQLLNAQKSGYIVY